MPVTLDKPLPDFSAPATSGITFSPASVRGKIVVLYFYPKDNTPGCTTEAMNFRDQYDAFEAAGAVVLEALDQAHDAARLAVDECERRCDQRGLAGLALLAAWLLR